VASNNSEDFGVQSFMLPDTTPSKWYFVFHFQLIPSWQSCRFHSLFH